MHRTEDTPLAPRERRVPRPGVAIAIGVALGVALKSVAVGIGVGVALAVLWGHLGGRAIPRLDAPRDGDDHPRGPRDA